MMAVQQFSQQKMNLQYVGIDISKEEIVYCFGSNWSNKEGSFKNTLSAIVQFIANLPSGSHCVLEPTNAYHLPLVRALEERGIPFSLVNPKVSHAYGLSLGSIAKTDKKGAAMLQRLGQERQLPASELPTKQTQAMRFRVQQWKHIKKQLRRAENRLEAASYNPYVKTRDNAFLEQECTFFEQQLVEIEALIEDEMEQEREAKLKLGATITGIGIKTARLLLLFTNGLQGFQSAKAVAKYLGLAPNVYESGNTKRKGHICKQGQGAVRYMLYNCARSAIRYNQSCKALYNRLREKGKSHKIAMVAVMNKLVRQFYAVVKTGIPFENGYGLEKQIKSPIST